jgi:hypothetical protein
MVFACRSSDKAAPHAGEGSGSAAAPPVVSVADARTAPRGKPARVITFTSRTEWTQFGNAFSADGDLIAATDVVDADHHNAIRIDRVVGDRLVEEAVLPSFAQGLALDGNTLAATGEGLVDLYARTSGTWARSETIHLDGPRACGDNFPQYVALRREILVVAVQSSHVCAYEHRGTAWVRTAALEAEHSFGGYAPFVFDGERLLLPRAEQEIVEIYRRTASGWARSATITKPPTTTSMFPAGAAIDGNRAVVGTASDVTVFDVSVAPPRAIATLAPQSRVDVPVFGRHMALAGARLAVYERDGTDLYAERDGAWQPGGRLEQVRSGDQVSFMDHIAIADLVWVGETDSNAGDKLPGGGKIYGYRWE